MNREEKKAYLNQYRELKQRIRSLEGQYRYWDCKSKSIPTSKIDMAGVHGSLKKEPITRHIDICILIDSKKKEAGEKLAELLELIESVPDPNGRTVLTMRYVDGMYFRQIAREMNYSVQHVWRLHDSALDALDVKDE